MKIRDLLDKLPEQEQRKLRKTRILSDAVKAAVYGGHTKKSPVGMAIQFNRDLKTYGLFEALLYVENYEKLNFYELGTAERGFHAAFIPNDSLETVE